MQGSQSLCNLMRCHGYLFVHPMFWTSRHLEVTGCRFEDVESTDIEDCNTRQTSHLLADQNQELPSHPKQLANSRAPLVKENALSHILCYEGSPFVKRVRRGPGFFFAGQMVHRPFYVVFGRPEQPGNSVNQISQPLVGHYDYSWLPGYRTKKLQQKVQPRTPPKGCINLAGASIFRKRLAKITPEDWAKDPYFVCILLAIAQFQERSLASSNAATHTARLLITNYLDSEYIHLYEAQITSELLKSLKSPATSTTCVDWPAIKRTKIPFQPFDTFQQRIQADLLAPGKVEIISSGLKRQHEQEDERRAVRRKT